VNNARMTPAERFSARLDELASALHRAGAPTAGATRLLELAALATIKAVELELRIEQRNAPPAVVAPADPARETLRAAA
jgi:hypothetical protein